MEYPRSLNYIAQGSNVVVLRTFSKAYGLAGLRIGYGMGPAELLSYCAQMRNTFSVSSLAQAGALAALEDQKHVERTVTTNASRAGHRSSAVRNGISRGSDVSELSCSLRLVRRCGVIAGGRLRVEGISVRPLRGWGAPTCIRVSIGTQQQNQAFLNAIHKIYNTVL